MQKIVYDFERWTVPEFETFRLATLSGEKETSSRLLSKLITEWDHPTLAPNDPLSYDELSLRDIGQIIRTINDQGNQMIAGKNLNLDGFKVNVVWNWGKFNRYTQAVSKYDVPQMQELLSEVILEWPFSFTPDNLETLNFEQFCRINAAVQKAVREAMQGD